MSGPLPWFVIPAKAGIHGPDGAMAPGSRCRLSGVTVDWAVPGGAA